MAARIPFILSQPARRDATAVELIENIVAAALLLPKLDANLVGDISTIEPGSTDHLCLQGHMRDVILASFLEMDVAAAAWQRLGQAGHFVDCLRSPAEIRAESTSVQGQRRIFYFQLTMNMRIANLLDQCQALVAAQAVQLVSLQLGPGKPGVSMPQTTNLSSTLASTPSTLRPAPGGASPTSDDQGQAERPMLAKLPIIAGAMPINSTPKNGTSSMQSTRLGDGAYPSTPLAASSLEENVDWSSVDKLVDDLDALDL
ncbi:MAG: hypothetical protein IT423_07255 [Pirellulaceae bacterium]|nr:hypothetical protein [Pirellulaceae bacterium]